MAKTEVTIPLSIPDVRVLKSEAGERGEIIITIESTKAGTSCRQCGKWIPKVHGRDEWVTIRHLPVFGRPSFLRYRPKRYQCQECEGHPMTTERLEWHDSNSPHSFAYDNQILLQLVNSTAEDVSVKEGLPYESVAGALERRIESSVDWTSLAEIEPITNSFPFKKLQILLRPIWDTAIVQSSLQTNPQQQRRTIWEQP